MNSRIWVDVKRKTMTINL